MWHIAVWSILYASLVLFALFITGNYTIYTAMAESASHRLWYCNYILNTLLLSDTPFATAEAGEMNGKCEINVAGIL